MGLQLKINAEERKRSFVVFDCTGDYSQNNPGGWGGPNPKKENIESSILEVVGPLLPQLPNFDPIQAALNIAPGAVPYIPPNQNGQAVTSLAPMYKKLELLDNFPNSKNLGYEVLPVQIVANVNKIVSGKWTLRWTVSGTTQAGKKFSTQTMLVVVFMNDVSCCVDKQLKNLDKNAFNDPKQKVIIELSALLDAACYDKGCGLYDQADETIRYLNQNCQCVDC